jgi:hypothetical protein
LANGESDAGGFDEFRLFCPTCRRNSATSALNNSICFRLPHHQRREFLIRRTSISGHRTMIAKASGKIH